MDETRIPPLSESVTVTVVNDPLPNLPPGVRNKIHTSLVNGMMTCKAPTARYAIVNMAGVLMARGEEHVVKTIIKDLQEMYQNGTGTKEQAS